MANALLVIRNSRLVTMTFFIGILRLTLMRKVFFRWREKGKYLKLAAPVLRLRNVVSCDSLGTCAFECPTLPEGN
jgi:succinate dehydrogenase/fumarate reductase-like Fe-S protein